MNIELKHVKIGEVIDKYVDNDENGAWGYGGKLNIRPQYQREFVYDAEKRNAVIDTIMKGFPLNVMYWVKNENGTYEILDGQQRTVSFCQYAEGGIPIKINGRLKAFGNLTNEEKQKFLDYELMIYVCEGTDTEKLDWFKIVNIGGMVLTDQELLNAIYTGSWLTHAKSIFSKGNCVAFNLSKNCVSPRYDIKRQGLLELALRWISHDNIELYMSQHQHDPNANELWLYFQNVINWVKLLFERKNKKGEKTLRKEIKFVNWGLLYDKYHKNIYDTNALEAEISKLMLDDDVTKKSGIYMYIFTHDEKYLNIRAFTPQMKSKAYERQGGKCAKCGEEYTFDEMEGDHIIPWSEGGKTNDENCQMLCKKCNRTKSNK